MGVLTEKTSNAIDRIESAITTLEEYPNDILFSDAGRLPQLTMRLIAVISKSKGDKT